MTDIDAIFAADRRHPPHERSLPWPRPEAASPSSAQAPLGQGHAGVPDACEYCAYADWTANGARARFFGHIDTCGDDLIRKARALVASEIADGHWS
jgi:hypothetical protein